MTLRYTLAIVLLVAAAVIINPPIIPDVGAMPPSAQRFIGLLALIVIVTAAVWLRQRPEVRPSTTRAAVVALSLVCAAACRCWAIRNHAGSRRPSCCTSGSVPNWPSSSRSSRTSRSPGSERSSSAGPSVCPGWPRSRRPSCSPGVQPFTSTSLTATMAACLAAPKLLVVYEWMSRYPRLIDSTESMPVTLLVQALFSHAQDFSSRPLSDLYKFQEYGAYLGPLAAGLALAVGYTLGGTASPWALLHLLPLFASHHVPSRFLLLAVLALGMLAGLGLDAIAGDAGRWRTIAAVALLGASSLDAAFVGPRNLAAISDGDIDVLPSAAHFVQCRDSDDKRMYSVARARMGALNCYEPLRPEAGQYLLGGGRVTLVEWSPAAATSRRMPA